MSHTSAGRLWSSLTLATPSLTITPAGENVLLSWPVTNGSSFTLYSTTNLAAAETWSTVAATRQTNSDQIVVTQPLEPTATFYRLQRP